MLSHMTANSQCPRRSCPDETLDHIFHCPHEMSDTPILLGCPLDIVDGLFQSYTFPPTHVHTSSGSTFSSTFLRGFMAAKWIDALSALGVDYPPCLMAWVLRFIWFDCTDLLWCERNAILHHSQNNHTQLESLQLEGKLHWFLDNQTFLLHYSWQALIRCHSRQNENYSVFWNRLIMSIVRRYSNGRMDSQLLQIFPNFGQPQGQTSLRKTCTHYYF